MSTWSKTATALAAVLVLSACAPASDTAEPSGNVETANATAHEAAAEVTATAHDDAAKATATVHEAAAEATATAHEATAEATTVAKAAETVEHSAMAAKATVAAEAAVEAVAEQAEATVVEAVAEAADVPAVKEVADQVEVVAAAAQSAGDAAAGAGAFAVCRACHSLDEGRNGLGPSLAGLAGRKAGGGEGFNYSDALKSSDVVWTTATLDEYLADTGAFIPGNRMAQLFPANVKDDTKRANIVAYLIEETSK